MFDPYLQFDGTCAEALAFYAGILGGRAQTMTYAQSPEPCPRIDPDALDRVMHGSLAVGDRLLMACDWPSSGWGPYPGLKGVSISLDFADVAEARRVFDALADGGTVQMPMAPTFWVEQFGMVVDRFGVAWMVNGGSMHAVPMH